MAAVIAITLAVNWWAPTRPLTGVAAASALGAILVLVPGGWVLAILDRPTLALPDDPLPGLADLRSHVPVAAVATGLLTILALPAVAAAFDPDAIGAAGVGRAWLSAALLALAAWWVAARMGRDRMLANRLALLRLTVGLATTGLALVVADADQQLLLTVVVVGGVLGLPADTEAVLRFDARITPGARTIDVPSHAAAVAQLVAISLGLVFALFGGPGDAPSSAELALSLALVGCLELLVVGVVLRPLVVDQGPVMHQILRPYRVAWFGSTQAHADGIGRHSMNGDGPEPELPGTLAPETDSGLHDALASLVRREFRLLAAGDQPAAATELDQVYLRGTPVCDQFVAYRDQLASGGLRVEGAEPELQAVGEPAGRNPVRVAVVVDHPAQRLVDGDGQLRGRRPSTRRWGTVWLSPGPGGVYRIAEAVEQGAGHSRPSI